MNLNNLNGLKKVSSLSIKTVLVKHLMNLNILNGLKKINYVNKRRHS